MMEKNTKIISEYARVKIAQTAFEVKWIPDSGRRDRAEL